jgi:uncharacterized protein YjbI with pentapeptide repeats
MAEVDDSQLIQDIINNTPRIGSKFMRISDNKIFTVVNITPAIEEYIPNYYEDPIDQTRNIQRFDLDSVDNNPQEGNTIELRGVRWGPCTHEVNTLGGTPDGFNTSFNWYLANISMYFADLQYLTFAYMDFSGADFRSANFSRAKLYNCIFTNANLTYATLSPDVGTIIRDCIGLDDAIGITTTGYTPETSTRMWNELRL